MLGPVHFEIEISDPQFKFKAGEKLKVSITTNSTSVGFPAEYVGDPVEVQAILDNDAIISYPIDSVNNVWSPDAKTINVSIGSITAIYDIEKISTARPIYEQCLRHLTSPKT